MERIFVDYPRDRIMAVAVVLLCVAAGAIVYTLAIGEATLVGVVAIIFPGATGLWLKARVDDKTPYLLIDHHGVWGGAPTVGVIAWDDIEDAWSEATPTHSILWLELRDPAKYLDPLPPVRRRVIAPHAKKGNHALALNLAGARVDLEHIQAVIRREIAARRGTGYVASEAGAPGTDAPRAARQPRLPQLSLRVSVLTWVCVFMIWQPLARVLFHALHDAPWEFTTQAEWISFTMLAGCIGAVAGAVHYRANQMHQGWRRDYTLAILVALAMNLMSPSDLFAPDEPLWWIGLLLKTTLVGLSLGTLAFGARWLFTSTNPVAPRPGSHLSARAPARTPAE
ncbi:MAG TPA: hypothetical protein VF625_10130 [Longimicrobium sp.]|jgi:hypothetical protein